MSKYIIRTVHIVEVPDDAGFNAADIFDDPDYFINMFENFSYCDSVEEKEGRWNRSTLSRVRSAARHRLSGTENGAIRSCDYLLRKPAVLRHARYVHADGTFYGGGCICLEL